MITTTKITMTDIMGGEMTKITWVKTTTTEQIKKENINIRKDMLWYKFLTYQVDKALFKTVRPGSLPK